MRFVKYWLICFSNSNLFWIEHAILCSINNNVSSKLVCFGPNRIRLPWMAGSRVLCTPSLNPPPIYAMLEYLYKCFSKPNTSTIKILWLQFLKLYLA